MGDGHGDCLVVTVLFCRGCGGDSKVSTKSWNFCPKGDGRAGSSGPLLPERNLTF